MGLYTLLITSKVVVRRCTDYSHLVCTQVSFGLGRSQLFDIYIYNYKIIIWSMEIWETYQSS